MNTDRGVIEVIDHLTHILSASGQSAMADDLHKVRRSVSDVLITGLALVRAMCRADREPTIDEMYMALHAHSKALTNCTGDDEKRACPDSHPLHRPAERRQAMSAHTPGPWAVCMDPPNPYWLAGRTIGAANPSDARRVCDVYSLSPPAPGSMAEANARLISAAPELLEAVQTVSEAMGAGLLPADVLNGLMAARIKSAIAKATGAEE